MHHKAQFSEYFKITINSPACPGFSAPGVDLIPPAADGMVLESRCAH